MADQSNNLWNILSMRPGPVLGQGLQEAYIKQDDRVLPKLTPGWETRNADRRVLPYASYLYCEGDMRFQPCQAVPYEQLPWFAEPSKSGGTVRTLDFPSVRQNTWSNEDGLPINATEDDVDKILNRAGQAAELRKKLNERQRGQFKGQVEERGESYGNGPYPKRQKVNEPEEVAPSYGSWLPAQSGGGQEDLGPPEDRRGSIDERKEYPPENEPPNPPSLNDVVEQLNPSLPSSEQMNEVAAQVNATPVQDLAAAAGPITQVIEQPVSVSGVVAVANAALNIASGFSDLVMERKENVLLNEPSVQFSASDIRDVVIPSKLKEFLEGVVAGNPKIFAADTIEPFAAELLSDINEMYLDVVGGKMVNIRAPGMENRLARIAKQMNESHGYLVDLRRIIWSIGRLPWISQTEDRGVNAAERKFELTDEMKEYKKTLQNMDMTRFTNQLRTPRALGSMEATGQAFMKYFNDLPMSAQDSNLSVLARAAMAQQVWGLRVEFSSGEIRSASIAGANIASQGRRTSVPTNVSSAKESQPIEIRQISGGQGSLVNDAQATAQIPQPVTST